MAWFGTCWSIHVKLDRHCIKQVAFSTTKGLSCGNWRSGIVFSKIDFGSLAVQTEWQHGIHLNCAIANSPYGKLYARHNQSRSIKKHT